MIAPTGSTDGGNEASNLQMSLPQNAGTKLTSEATSSIDDADATSSFTDTSTAADSQSFEGGQGTVPGTESGTTFSTQLPSTKSSELPSGIQSSVGSESQSPTTTTDVSTSSLLTASQEQQQQQQQPSLSSSGSSSGSSIETADSPINTYEGLGLKVNPSGILTVLSLFLLF